MIEHVKKIISTLILILACYFFVITVMGLITIGIQKNRFKSYKTNPTNFYEPSDNLRSMYQEKSDFFQLRRRTTEKTTK